MILMITKHNIKKYLLVEVDGKRSYMINIPNINKNQYIYSLLTYCSRTFF